ncbi:UNVERIFIED_CONTAM: hypothetical protein GTU68_056411, partial [Idotea baltica]|nr:hypothetical protein [Idotea baltica]
VPTHHVLIKNKLGLHARAAVQFVRIAKQFPCQILIGINEKSLVDGKNIMSVMMLAASQGTWLQLETCGYKEKEALLELETLINNYFNESQ